MFFEKLDIISYDPKGLGKGKDATNILNSILVKYRPVTNTTEFFYHTVKDGDTPDTLAYRFYGNSELNWIIIIMNNVVDPFYDWALDANKFAAMMSMRYGAGHEGDVHHFIDITTEKRLDEVAALDAIEYFIANGVYPINVSPVTNQEFELELNDARREVKILRPKYVQDFINQFEDLMSRETLV